MELAPMFSSICTGARKCLSLELLSFSFCLQARVNIYWIIHHNVKQKKKDEVDFCWRPIAWNYGLSCWRKRSMHVYSVEDEALTSSRGGFRSVLGPLIRNAHFATVHTRRCANEQWNRRKPFTISWHYMRNSRGVFGKVTDERIPPFTRVSLHVCCMT